MFSLRIYPVPCSSHLVHSELFVDDKRNIILAFALTALILFGWPYVAEQFFPTPQPTQAPVSQNAPSSSSGTGPITETVQTIRPLHQAIRSEEHTSELQSLMRISYAVFCLKTTIEITHITDSNNRRFTPLRAN